MPRRLIVLRFTKDIDEVAEAFKPMLKEPVITEWDEQLARNIHARDRAG